MIGESASPDSTRANVPRGAWWAWSLAGLAAVGAWRWLGAWTPPQESGYVVCALKSVAHVACPTCGFTRAVLALARGGIADSLRLHPLALPVLLEVAAVWALWGAALVRGAPILRQRWIPALATAHAAVFVVVWLVRFLTGTLPV